jgi:hypothetical protein
MRLEIAVGAGIGDDAGLDAELVAVATSDRVAHRRGRAGAARVATQQPEIVRTADAHPFGVLILPAGPVLVQIEVHSLARRCGER